jgi:hypothetical protein
MRHDHGRPFHHRPEPRLAIPQRLLLLLALGDVMKDLSEIAGLITVGGYFVPAILLVKVSVLE